MDRGEAPNSEVFEIIRKSREELMDVMEYTARIEGKSFKNNSELIAFGHRRGFIADAYEADKLREWYA